MSEPTSIKVPPHLIPTLPELCILLASAWTLYFLNTELLIYWEGPETLASASLGFPCTFGKVHVYTEYKYLNFLTPAKPHFRNILLCTLLLLALNRLLRGICERLNARTIPLFRFSLLRLILMSLLFGFFLWMNVSPRLGLVETGGKGIGDFYEITTVHGWPWVWNTNQSTYPSPPSSTPLVLADALYAMLWTLGIAWFVDVLIAGRQNKQAVLQPT